MNLRKIGVFSDLHLEASSCSISTADLDVLVLAGDIGVDFSDILHFFQTQVPPDLPVVMVLGNHEYEGKVVQQAIPALKQMLQAFPNVHVLENEAITLCGIKFIGCTLWSDFAIGKQPAVEMNWASSCVADFNNIFVQTESKETVPLSPQYVRDVLHQRSVLFLEQELILKNTTEPIVVVSHFAPHPRSIHPDYHSALNGYFVSDLSHLLGYSEFWIHGHVHNSFDYTELGTRVISNPRGYSRWFNLSQNPAYNPNFVLTVPLLS